MPEGLKAVVFDWAGTVIDHGSLAPMGAFVATFAAFGIGVTVEEARGPMGRAKRDHVAALMALPQVGAQWAARYGADPDEAAIDKVYAAFVPANVSAVRDHSRMIAGAVECVAALRSRGLKIGTTTGYVREIMDVVLPEAARQGFVPDSLVCAGDLAEGRPAPLMMFQTFVNLGVWPAWRVVKVDDTPVGIAEGLNAGCWTVGVALTGNAFGLSVEDTERLSPADVAERSARARDELRQAGAHEVIDSVADLLPVIDRIEARLARGDRP